MHQARIRQDAANRKMSSRVQRTKVNSIDKSKGVSYYFNHAKLCLFKDLSQFGRSGKTKAGNAQWQPNRDVYPSMDKSVDMSSFSLLRLEFRLILLNALEAECGKTKGYYEKEKTLKRSRIGQRWSKMRKICKRA